MFNPNKRAVSPVIAIVLLLMMTVAAAGAAYFWLTTMQSRMQKASYKSIEKVMEATGRRVVAQATLCKPTYPYKGLVGYWMMDEGSGDYANDSSGNDHTGILKDDNISDSESPQGPVWVDGKVGKALDFDNKDDYVLLSDNFGIFDGTQPFSVSFWSNLESVADRNPVLAFRRKRHLVLSFGNNVNNENFTIRLRDEDVGWQNPATTSAVNTGQWYHIVAVYDVSNGWQLYVDGSKDGSSSSSNDIASINRENRISYNSWGAKQYFDGKIDEVRIIGSEEIPKATWVANLKHDGTNVETDAYNASSIDTGELATLKFYFKNFKPNTGYKIELQGTGTSTTVSC